METICLISFQLKFRTPRISFNRDWFLFAIFMESKSSYFTLQNNLFLYFNQLNLLSKLSWFTLQYFSSSQSISMCSCLRYNDSTPKQFISNKLETFVETKQNQFFIIYIIFFVSFSNKSLLAFHANEDSIDKKRGCCPSRITASSKVWRTKPPHFNWKTNYLKTNLLKQIKNSLNTF